MTDDKRRLAAHRLAEFVTGLPAAAVPEAEISLARLRVLDTLGLVLGGCDTPAAAAALEVARSNTARPGRGASLLGDPAPVAPCWAAFAHGIVAHCRDFDDTFPDSVVHPGSTINSVALALGEARSLPPREVLAAVAIGYEVAARLGSAAGRRLHARGFHATGIHGPVIAACVASRLMELDPTRTVSAIGLAASMSGGLLQFLADGSWSKWLHVGWSTHGGIVAAELAARGFRGPEGALDGESGLFAAFLWPEAPESSVLTDGLGVVWRGREALPKYFPCAHVIQPFIAAALALRAEVGAAAAARIFCRVAPWAVPIICEPQANKRVPEGEMDVIASLFFQVATAWVDGHVELDVLDAATRKRPELLGMARRVDYDADPAFTEGFDGSVEITLEDGRRIERRVPPSSIVPDAVMRKFRSLAARSLATDRVEPLAACLEAFPDYWAGTVGAALRSARCGRGP